MTGFILILYLITSSAVSSFIAGIKNRDSFYWYAVTLFSGGAGLLVLVLLPKLSGKKNSSPDRIVIS